jgi:hypothetical protein
MSIANISISVVLLLIAIGLIVAHNRGLITNDFLSRWSNIASILALVLAIVIFALPSLNSQTNTASVEQDKDAIAALVNLEVRSTIQLDLVTLESLYASNAIVIDHRGTPTDESDDIVYQGWENIQKHYLGIQLFYKQRTMSLIDLSVDVVRNKATASHRGTIINGVSREDLTIYHWEKRDGRWLITRLAFAFRPLQHVPTSEFGPDVPIQPP